jgi:hypothetical protein
MRIYIITLAGSLLLAQLAVIFQNKPKTDRGKYKLNPLFVWLLIALLVSISGFRYMNYYLSDEWNYRVGLNSTIGASLDLKSLFKSEGGSYLYTWILANVFRNSQAYIFFSALITNVLIVKTLEQYAKPFPLAIFLYIAGGAFFTSMNIIRQYIAVSIIFYGLKYIIKKQFWPYLITVFLAASFHYSAWIMLPLYFILIRDDFSKNWPLAFVIAIIVMINFDKIATWILPGTKYEHYLNDIFNQGYGTKIIRVTVWMVSYSILVIYRNQLFNYVHIKPVFLNMILFSMSILVASISYVYIARFDVYFGICALILVPCIPSLFEKRCKYFVAYSMILLFFLFGSYQMLSTPQYHNIIFENMSGTLY